MQRRTLSVIVCFALSGCATRDADPSKAPAESRTDGALAVRVAPATAEAPLRYPSGPWWSADVSKLYVSAAHILVTYRGAERWSFLPSTPRSERSRDEALKQARALQSQLDRDPTRFEALAVSASDDTHSARFGGVIGTFRAARVPPEIVDALGHLKPNEISHVVETSAGFHLIRRLAPPPNEARSFAHIVIKADGDMGWKRMDREVPKRSRDEARSLAQKVAAEAKRDPTRFAALVQQYSDADDVIRNGDVGALTPYDGYGSDLTLYNRMAHLGMNEVSEAFESPTGFEVVQRTPEDAREFRAASVITLLYRGAQSNSAIASTRIKEKAQQIAGTLVRELRAKPALFAQRRTEYCELYHCDKPVRFRRGREISALDQAVAKLQIGEIATVDSPVGLLIIRREDPETIAAVESTPLTDFPTAPLAEATPPPPQEPPSVSDLFAQLAEQGVRELSLQGEKATSFHRIFTELASRIEAQPDGDFSRDEAWADAQVLALLGEDKNEEFVRFRRRFLARLQ
jgi:PPIC-type PPIASE domain